MTQLVIPDHVKAEPAYADGYSDGLHGDSFDTDRGDDEAYCYGFEAGDRAAKLFQQNGFERNGDSFVISLSAGGAA